jgi:hypothetical protein
MRNTFYKGAQGNLSLHVMTIALAALAGSGAKVLESELPIGAEITGVRFNGEALGSGTAYKVDLVDKAGGSRPILAATTSTGITAGMKPLKPIYIGDEGVCDLILTNSGASAATGEVTIAIEYRFKGY